jgi:MYXO-CTERM domain-containing protein
MKSQLLISASALLAAVALPAALPLARPADAQPTTVTIALTQQNSSGQSGTATLSADGNQTRVVIDLANSPAGPQPAHIHTGTCETLGGVAFNLEFPRDGKSTSTVATPLSALQTGSFAINVHKSPQEASVYVACGTIPAAAASAPGAQEPKPAASPAAAAPAAQPKPAEQKPMAQPKPAEQKPTAAPKPAASPAVQVPAALPRTGDGSTVMSMAPAIAGALGLVGLGLGIAVRRRRR